MDHRPPPPGWPPLVACLFYRDPARAIAWLCDAFGFELRLRVDDEAGRVVHSELVYGGAMVMVGGTADYLDDERAPLRRHYASPQDLGGRMNQSVLMFVDDADAHCAHARSRGAVVESEPATHDYGPDYWADRSWGALDLEGHSW